MSVIDFVQVGSSTAPDLKGVAKPQDSISNASETPSGSTCTPFGRKVHLQWFSSSDLLDDFVPKNYVLHEEITLGQKIYRCLVPGYYSSFNSTLTQNSPWSYVHTVPEWRPSSVYLVGDYFKSIDGLTEYVTTSQFISSTNPTGPLPQDIANASVFALSWSAATSYSVGAYALIPSQFLPSSVQCWVSLVSGNSTRPDTRTTLSVWELQYPNALDGIVVSSPITGNGTVSSPLGLSVTLPVFETPSIQASAGAYFARSLNMIPTPISDCTAIPRAVWDQCSSFGGFAFVQSAGAQLPGFPTTFNSHLVDSKLYGLLLRLNQNFGMIVWFPSSQDPDETTPIAIQWYSGLNGTTSTLLGGYSAESMLNKTSAFDFALDLNTAPYPLRFKYPTVYSIISSAQALLTYLSSRVFTYGPTDAEVYTDDRYYTASAVQSGYVPKIWGFTNNGYDNDPQQRDIDGSWALGRNLIHLIPDKLVVTSGSGKGQHFIECSENGITDGYAKLYNKTGLSEISVSYNDTLQYKTLVQMHNTQDTQTGDPYPAFHEGKVSVDDNCVALDWSFITESFDSSGNPVYTNEYDKVRLLDHLFEVYINRDHKFFLDEDNLQFESTTKAHKSFVDFHTQDDTTVLDAQGVCRALTCQGFYRHLDVDNNSFANFVFDNESRAKFTALHLSTKYTRNKSLAIFSFRGKDTPSTCLEDGSSVAASSFRARLGRDYFFPLVITQRLFPDGQGGQVMANSPEILQYPDDVNPFTAVHGSSEVTLGVKRPFLGWYKIINASVEGLGRVNSLSTSAPSVYSGEWSTPDSAMVYLEGPTQDPATGLYDYIRLTDGKLEVSKVSGYSGTVDYEWFDIGSCIPTHYYIDTAITALEQRLTAAITALEQRLTAAITALEQRLTAAITALEQRLTAAITALDLKFSPLLAPATASTATLSLVAEYDVSVTPPAFIGYVWQ